MRVVFQKGTKSLKESCQLKQNNWQLTNFFDNILSEYHLAEYSADLEIAMVHNTVYC